MMSQCTVCKKVFDYGPPYMTRNGTVVVDKIKCEPCREKERMSKWRYSKVYHVTVIQKGMPGRRLKNTKMVPLFFTPAIPILHKGNQDYVYVDVEEFASELYWIKKGTKVKLSFYWDEHGVLRIRNIGV